MLKRINNKFLVKNSKTNFLIGGCFAALVFLLFMLLPLYGSDLLAGLIGGDSSSLRGVDFFDLIRLFRQLGYQFSFINIMGFSNVFIAMVYLSIPILVFSGVLMIVSIIGNEGGIKIFFKHRRLSNKGHDVIEWIYSVLLCLLTLTLVAFFSLLIVNAHEEFNKLFLQNKIRYGAIILMSITALFPFFSALKFRFMFFVYLIIAFLGCIALFIYLKKVNLF
jgi:hypothetical protein